VADPVSERDDEAKAWMKGSDVAPETLNRVLITLWHHADGAQQKEYNDNENNKNKNSRTGHIKLLHQPSPFQLVM
jgi:hypothetical protein